MSCREERHKCQESSHVNAGFHAGLWQSSWSPSQCPLKDPCVSCRSGILVQFTHCELSNRYKAPYIYISKTPCSIFANHIEKREITSSKSVSQSESRAEPCLKLHGWKGWSRDAKLASSTSPTLRKKMSCLLITQLTLSEGVNDVESPSWGNLTKQSFTVHLTASQRRRIFLRS